MILRVGLTGGLACGKSSIARIFAGLGCVTMDADAVVARLYRSGGAGHDVLIEAYGPEILLPDGEIDRGKLADIAFASSESAAKLNNLIHPLVIAEERRIIDDEEYRFPDRDRIYVIEGTLLLESGGRERYDRIIVVDVEPAAQVQRAMERGMDREDAERRIARQMERQERLALADYVIDNSGDRRRAEVAVYQLYEKLREDLQAKKKGELRR